MTLAELPAWAAALIGTARVAHLALLDDRDLPRVLPVTFAIAGEAVWSAIDQKPKRAAEPARLRYLRRRPEAALCVDDYAEDWERLAWVQLLGRVEVVATGDGREALVALARKYPQYASSPPPGPLLRLDAERSITWRAGGRARRSGA